MFREDLYYRLNVLTLNLPPLRDCPQDIMPLTELFVARFADEQGVPRPETGRRPEYCTYALCVAGKCAAVKERYLSRTDTTGRL